MNQEMKVILLKRKFSSLDYAREMKNHLEKSLEGLKNSIEWFYAHPPEGWETWHISDRPQGWEQRVIPNFEAEIRGIDEAIFEAQNGDWEYLQGSSNSVMSLSRNMDVMGFKWMDHVDDSVAEVWGKNQARARKIGSNIYKTIGNHWRPGSILKESITGPIDEEELLKYLKPGESAD